MLYLLGILIREFAAIQDSTDCLCKLLKASLS